MIKFDSFSLNNGLRVILNKDDKTPLVAVNILYEVGAKNENPNATGFAHLFEHLMFAGSKQFPSYDEAVQIMGGESNAFTNNDFTNYYLTLPAEFLFHALRLEADRMQYLNINTKSLEVQRKVVIEEFKQRYINQPYGDLWKEIRQLAYKQHPYQWQTIGKEISHIENATLEQVSEFYDNYYQASNAILSISGNVNIDTVKANLDSTFGKIPYKKTIFQPYEMEAKQTEVRQNTVYRDVPSSVICLIFPMSDRKSSLYYSQDLLSDVLSNGKSSRMYKSLVVDKKLFTEINAFISGDDDPGLFIVMGKYCEGVAIQEGEQAIWEELKAICDNPVTEEELRKMKNKNEANYLFSNMKILDKAQNLAYYAHLNLADNINKERDFYENVSINDLQQAAREMFLENNYSVLYYLKIESK